MGKPKGNNIFADGIKAPQKSRATNKAKALQLQDDEFDADRNDEPEEVSADSDDIKKLRELHEQMMLPANKRTKKRRARSTTMPIIVEENKAATDDDELDESILAALDGVDSKEASRSEVGNKRSANAEDQTNTDIRAGGINIYSTKSRKMYDSKTILVLF